ncbi:MAG TPA: L,D-transpeptidase [Actinophytocola sp.]|uniref:L,D-transpeptidase n=1 Tax=Actinophytocola sp. TaxID=1872138 RepID=UPI002DB7F7B5|nr:L,D-transpeptidase [Actinophytocola sp.]HEU5472060.1 L,D-transpeptidase [Actinophytocola sp.]
MRIKKLIVGAALTGAAVLSACGPAPQARPAADTGTPSPTTTTTTTPTTTTTTPPPAPPAAEPAPAPAPAPAPKPKPTTTKPKPKPAPKPAGGTPCTITDGACIDLSANRSWLLKGGVVSYGPVPITHGRPGYRTPPGTFRVSFKDIDHKSSLFDDAPMPYSVFFNGGIAFHAGSLRELSHGCIHLSNGAAKTYYNSLAVGATVQVVR